jgi:uncharacterized ion transporter superfamily protein YfcC
VTLLCTDYAIFFATFCANLPFFAGMGMGLSLLVMGVYLLRLTVHKLPPGDVIASAFLPLGPFGQGAYGLIQISKAGLHTFTAQPVHLMKNVSNAAEVIYIVSVLGGLLLWG